MARPRSDSPALFDLAQRPDFSIELSARKRGLWPVAGMDEAGRGPLAGPVVAAAVILDPDHIPAGLDDSKRLKAAQREALFSEILTSAIAVAFASVSAEAIDRINILQASMEAMRRALALLPVAPLLALADGNHVPRGLRCEGQALVKGDQRSQSIAAASIVAKVMRDRMMSCCPQRNARYGFDGHAGYGTARHQAALREHGALIRIHRMTFAPLTTLGARSVGDKQADETLRL